MPDEQKKEKTLKCIICNRKLDFYFHECKRAIQEYLGCRVCDDWCSSCKEKKVKED